MNVENIKKVRDHIAGLPPERFSMREWDCGTAACLGGWTERFFVGDEEYLTVASIMDCLGISPSEAEDLFHPGRFMTETFNPYDATPAQAVRVLDHLLETGEVDWSIIDRKES